MKRMKDEKHGRLHLKYVRHFVMQEKTIIFFYAGAIQVLSKRNPKTMVIYLLYMQDIN